MSKKRIKLCLEGQVRPKTIVWYLGTPAKDIMASIRAVSTLLVRLCLEFALSGESWALWG